MTGSTGCTVIFGHLMSLAEAVSDANRDPSSSTSGIFRSCIFVLEDDMFKSNGCASRLVRGIKVCASRVTSRNSPHLKPTQEADGCVVSRLPASSDRRLALFVLPTREECSPVYLSELSRLHALEHEWFTSNGWARERAHQHKITSDWIYRSLGYKVAVDTDQEVLYFQGLAAAARPSGPPVPTNPIQRRKFDLTVRLALGWEHGEEFTDNDGVVKRRNLKTFITHVEDVGRQEGIETSNIRNLIHKYREAFDDRVPWARMMSGKKSSKSERQADSRITESPPPPPSSSGPGWPAITAFADGSKGGSRGEASPVSRTQPSQTSRSPPSLLALDADREPSAMAAIDTLAAAADLIDRRAIDTATTSALPASSRKRHASMNSIEGGEGSELSHTIHVKHRRLGSETPSRGLSPMAEPYSVASRLEEDEATSVGWQTDFGDNVVPAVFSPVAPCAAIDHDHRATVKANMLESRARTRSDSSSGDHGPRDVADSSELPGNGEPDHIVESRLSQQSSNVERSPQSQLASSPAPERRFSAPDDHIAIAGASRLEVTPTQQRSRHGYGTSDDRNSVSDPVRLVSRLSVDAMLDSPLEAESDPRRDLGLRRAQDAILIAEDGPDALPYFMVATLEEILVVSQRDADRKDDELPFWLIEVLDLAAGDLTKVTLPSLDRVQDLRDVALSKGLAAFKRALNSAS